MWYWIRKYKMKKARGPAGKKMFQKDLNATFEYPPFYFAYKYAYLCKTVMSAALYAPLVPLVIPMTVVGIFAQYWLDKWIMLRHCSRQRSVGPELAKSMIEHLELPLIMFSFGNAFFNLYVTTQTTSDLTLQLIGLAIGIANAVLPMDDINEYLFKIKEEVPGHEKYSDMRLEFLEDYDRCNPATREISMDKFAEEKQAKKKEQ